MAFDKLKKIIDGDMDESYVTDKPYVSDDNTETKSNSQMILIEPRAYSESQTIADHLKAKNTVVVNLKRVTTAQAKRIIDFLTGTLYAINGDMQKIGTGIYLCTPKNVSVQGSISDVDDVDKKSKNKDDEDIDW